MSPWIKLCHDTPRKPEVLEIAELLGVSRLEAFGLAMEFWIWVDSHSKGGELRRLRVSHVDAALSHSGLASALLSVGWLAQAEDGSLVVPNFDRHSGETAKERALRTERNARHRKQMRRKRDASETVSETVDRLANVSLSSSSSISSSCVSRSETPEASEAKPTAPRKTMSYPADFERFWDAYHIRRAGKADAIKAWKKLSDETREKAIAAAKVYSDTKRDTGCPYICLPATWLNEGRFDDDPETWLSEPARRQLTIKRKLEAFAAEEAAEQQAKGVVNGYR